MLMRTTKPAKPSEPLEPREPVRLLALESATLRKGQQTFGPFCIQVQPGERVAILGPSGAGKSTLLKLMAREWIPATGQVWFGGKLLSQWSLHAISQHRAVLPQSSDVAFGLRVDLVIGLGRVARPHDPSLNHVVAQAAALAHATHLLGRRFDMLSGGEQARVQLARVFAQLWDAQGGLILVDEPLAALDPGLQFDLLDSLDAYAKQRGHAVVAVLHDINHAMQGFERMLLVKDGKLAGDLPTTAAALPALEALYGISLSSVTNRQGDLVVSPLRRTGQGARNQTVAARA